MYEDSELIPNFTKFSKNHKQKKMFFVFFFLSFGESVIGKAAPEDIVPSLNFTEDSLFMKVKDIWFMTFIFPFLMMFIKKYEWGVVLASLLISAPAFIVFVFIDNVCLGKPFDLYLQAKGIICAITAIISLGVFAGTLKYYLYIVVGLLFGFCYYLMDYLCVSGNVILGVVDPGGAIGVHMFGCYWGIGFALILREKRIVGFKPIYTTHSVGWAWLSSLVLYVLWPSFTSVFYAKEAGREVSNITMMGGLGSIFSAYFTELICSKGKIDPLIYAYCLLAGLVGISSPMFMIGPWGAFLIGIICGVLSTISFHYLHPFLGKIMGINDITGVHNLHGVCSWISILCGMIAAYIKKFEGVWTLVASLICTAIALATGVICALLVKPILCNSSCNIPDDELLNDRADFVFPDDNDEESAEKGGEL